MKRVIIADTHLGAIPAERVALLSRFIASLGPDAELICNGDTVDTLLHEKAAANHLPLLPPGTRLIAGNHDFDVSAQRELLLDGQVFVTHGDLVDFGYTAARLQQASWRSGTPVERLLSLWRRWSLPDVFSFYHALYDLGDEAVGAFEHPRPKPRPELLAEYLRMLRAVLRAPETPRVPITNLPPLRGRGTFGGYFTDDPHEVVTRVLALYPASRRAHTIVLGHLHRAIDERVTVAGRTYRLVVLNAWTPSRSPQYAEWDGKTLTVRDVEGRA